MTASYIGIDLHRTVIQVCVLDARGERVAEERICYETLEEGLRAVSCIRRFAPDCRIAVEALGLNRWFVNASREAGLEVLVCDPRKLELRKLGKKTDRRDAHENGLIRQYLPKRTSMAAITQRDCNAIAQKLNARPRKRYNYQTPEERFHAA